MSLTNITNNVFLVSVLTDLCLDILVALCVCDYKIMTGVESLLE
jgi:hypothetical protein